MFSSPQGCCSLAVLKVWLTGCGTRTPIDTWFTVLAYFGVKSHANGPKDVNYGSVGKHLLSQFFSPKLPVRDCRNGLYLSHHGANSSGYRIPNNS